MGVPAGIQSSFQAQQDQLCAAGRRQAPPPVRLLGCNLNFNASVVHRVGGSACHQPALLHHTYPQSPALEICKILKQSAKIPGPGLCHRLVVQVPVKDAQRKRRFESLGKPAQLLPVKPVRFLADGIAEGLLNALAQDRLNPPGPRLILGHQNGGACLADEAVLRLTGKKAEIAYHNLRCPGRLLLICNGIPHAALEARPNHGLLPAGKEGGDPFQLHHMFLPILRPPPAAFSSTRRSKNATQKRPSGRSNPAP